MKVLVVDDQPVTHFGIRSLLHEMDGVEIVAEATESREVLRLAREMDPTIVILDPNLDEEPDGWKICRELKSLEKPPQVLIYTACSTRKDMAAASFAGADSYLCKRVKGEWLPEVVGKLRNGQRMWIPCNEEDSSKDGFRAQIETANLTSRQKEIALLAMNRRSNEEIARELHISVNTVKAHVKNILRELNLSSRQGLFNGPGPAGSPPEGE